MNVFRSGPWRRYAPWLALVVAALAGAILRYGLLDHLSPRRFSYYIESCFRFRYAEMRMRGQEPPALDRKAQWPEGFATDRMILSLPDRTAALFYRLHRGNTFLAARALIIALSAASVLAFVPLALAVFRRPWPAAAATVIYAGTFGAFSRSIGNFLREDFAWPALLVATAAVLYLLTWKAGRGRWPAAAVAAAATFWAGSCWHMSQFYIALLAAAIIIFGLAGRGRDAAVAGGALWLGLTAAALLNKPLWFKGALWNASAALTLAPVAGWALARALRRENASRWFLAGATAALLTASFLFGRSSAYGHVYALIWAKIINLGRYPGPAALSPQARLFWVGPYESPSFAKLVFQYGFLGVTFLVGLALWYYDLGRRRLTSGHFVAAAAVAATFLYLLIGRLTIFLAPWVAALSIYPAARAGRWKIRIYALTFLAVFWGLHLYGTLSHFRVGGLYYRIVETVARPKPETPWYYGSERAELFRWLNDAPPGALLTDFATSPLLLYFTDRPIALHPMFEVPTIREKALAYAKAALADEETFYELCRRWRIRYVIYYAPQVLSHTPGSFYRIAAAEPAPDSAAGLMQFHPEKLRRFRLVHETYTTRVFEVGRPYDGFKASAYHPLFDLGRFPGIPSDEELLAFYSELSRANNYYVQGVALQAGGRFVAAAAVFNSALRLHPDYEDANLRLGQCEMALGRHEDARAALGRAAAARPDDPTPRAYLNALKSQERLPGGSTR